MKFKDFRAIVSERFPRLTCEETVTRNGDCVFATTDWTVVYFPATGLWNYNGAKSFGGSGKTLEEAIANLPSLMDEY